MRKNLIIAIIMFAVCFVMACCADAGQVVADVNEYRIAETETPEAAVETVMVAVQVVEDGSVEATVAERSYQYEP